MNEILQRHADVVVVNADHIARAMGLKLAAVSEEARRETFGGNPKTGHFYLYRDEEFPGKVFECVVSHGGFSMTSLYMAHRIFGTRADLMRARESLMDAIGATVGLPAESIGVDDQDRGTVGLADMATGQLIDMLNGRVGNQIIVANNLSVAGMTKEDTSIHASGGSGVKVAKVKNQDAEKMLRDANVAEGNITIAVTR